MDRGGARPRLPIVGQRLLKIYWKIFAGFWLATFLMVSLALLLGNLVGSTPKHKPPPLPQLSRQVEKVLRQQGVGGLQAWLAQHESLSPDSVYIADRLGQPVYPETLPENIQALFLQHDGRRVEIVQRIDGVYFKRRLRGEPGQQWQMVLRVPPAWMQLFRDRPRLPYLTALLVSGLVCYLLALLLTRRLKRLSGTVRSLADGQFSARAEWAGKQGQGDEIQRLGADVNLMADRLQQLVMGQDQLIKGVSHELRSPLARMQILVELIRQRGEVADNEQLARLQGEIHGVETIIGDLLLLPRLEQNFELADEMIDAHALLQILMVDCAAGNSHFNLQVDAGDYLVQGRGSLLRSLFENVLENARRHAPDDSAITVLLSQENGQLQLDIRDRGEGLPESELQRIFEPFYRLSTARDRASGGVGLGLTIAHRVARAHGGEISACNAKPGLCVRIRLPLAGD